MPQTFDYVIVGGGIGGMVLARRLVLGGRRVAVIEASDHTGGTVSSHDVHGIRLDAGAESFATRGETVARLARSLGLGDDLVTPNPEGAWLQPASGPAFRLPENSLLGIPGSPLAKDVTAIIGGRAAVRAYVERFIPSAVGSRSATLGDLVRKRMGPIVLDQLVRPIARGVQSVDPDELPLEQAAPGLAAALFRTGSLAAAVLELRATSARAGSAVGGIRGGVFRIADQLRFDLERFGVEVRLGRAASAIGPDSIRVGRDRIDGRVVVAAPGLVGQPITTGARITLATLVIDQPQLDAMPRGTGVLVADGVAGISARALTHSTAKWKWLAELTGGRHVLRLSYDGSGPAGDNELLETARADAAALLGVPIERGAVLDFARMEWYRPPRVTTTPDAIPLAGESIAGTGLASVVARSEALAAKLLDGVEG